MPRKWRKTSCFLFLRMKSIHSRQRGKKWKISSCPTLWEPVQDTHVWSFMPPAFNVNTSTKAKRSLIYRFRKKYWVLKSIFKPIFDSDIAEVNLFLCISGSKPAKETFFTHSPEMEDECNIFRCFTKCTGI